MIRKYRKNIIAVLSLVLIILLVVLAVSFIRDPGDQKDKAKSAPKTTTQSKNSGKDDAEDSAAAKEAKMTPEQKLAAAKANGTAKGYPQDIMELLDKNAETVDFVNDYEKKKDNPPADDIGQDYVEGEIPSLIQWDERWGYTMYGDSHLARSGCGPTCMSMVVVGLTGDHTVTPNKVADYAVQHNFLSEENDTLWEFMEEAPANWGIKVSEGNPEDENLVKNQLDAGGAIICSVGPGYFTDGGHFIVLTAYHDGMVQVHDPFSITNTQKEWKYSDIMPQIKAMWLYSK